MSYLCLKCFSYTADRFGLLDSEDVSQINSRLSTASAKRRIFVEALMLSTVALILLYFATYAAFTLVFCVSLVGTLPQIFIWLRYTSSDRDFHSFIRTLRQRELALFGVKNMGLAASPINLRTCCRRARLECIEHLRQLITAFNAYSVAILQLAASSSETESLLFNFVNDDLHQLATKPIALLDDDDLQISSLKALWRYAFLARSEFIRICMLILLEDTVLFFSHFRIIVQTFLQTTYISANLITENFLQIRTNNGFPSSPECSTTQLSPLKTCIAQLEWALENLYAMDNELTSGSVATTVACLKNVISVMDGEYNGRRGSINGNQCDQEQMPDSPTSNGSVASDFETLVEPLQLLDNDEFQIFEMDTSERANQQDQHPDGEEDNDTDCIMRSFEGSHLAMLRELGCAIESRKEQCIVREMEALARARKVPIEEIRREELDRAPFEQRIDRDGANREQRNKGTTKPFGGMPSSADLGEIIAKRKQFMDGGNIFGESSDED